MKALAVTGTLAAVVAAAGAAPAAAPVPPKWLAPRDVSDAAADAVIPDIAVDAAGGAVAVWVEAKGSIWTVQASKRPPAGTWGAPRQLSEPGSPIQSPQVAVGGSTTVAVWVRNNGKHLIVQATDLDAATGTWAAASSLSRNGEDSQVPAVAVDDHGDAVVMWASVGLHGWTAQAAYKPAGAAWQPPVPLDAPQGAVAFPDVVIDPAGNATAVWTSTPGIGWRVHASHRGSDGTWSRDATISSVDPKGSIEPHVAQEGSGGVPAVWSRSIGKESIIESSARNPSTRAWSPAKRLFPTAPSGFAPQIAVDARGDGVLLWLTSGQAGLSIVTSTRRAGGRWSPPFPLQSAGIDPLSPDVALDAKGDAVAVWIPTTSGSQRVQAANLPAGGNSWSAPRTLSMVGGDAATPQVALDGDGDGAVTWARVSGQAFVIQTAGFDATGPALLGLLMPGTGKVGKRLTFDVSPQDVWSAVRSVRWTFGDGATGSGKVTRHTYAQPGRYAVEVAATDSIGHVRTARRWVTISKT